MSSSNVDSVILKSLFDESYIGKFLEIGVDTGTDHMYCFLEQGWQGVYCEPDPISCQMLIDTTEKFNQQVTIINSAITPTSGLTDFFVCINGHGTSSLNPTWAEINKPVVPNPVVRKLVTNGVSVQQLFDFIGTEFDIISIDAEGSDEAIIKAIDWSTLPQCKVLIVEGGWGNDICDQLASQGRFKFVTQTELGNSIFVKEE